MSSSTDKNLFLKKKLLYKSLHRGCRENDLILGNFAKTHLEVMNRTELHYFAEILAQGDNDIYDWVTEKTSIPIEQNNIIMHRLLTFTRKLLEIN